MHFDKVGFIKLFIVILFDALQADGQHARKLGSRFVGDLYKNDIVIVLCARKRLIGIAIAHKMLRASQAFPRDTLTDLTYLVQVRAGYNIARFGQHTDIAADGIFHLANDTLKNSVSHKTRSLSLHCSRQAFRLRFYGGKLDSYLST